MFNFCHQGPAKVAHAVHLISLFSIEQTLIRQKGRSMEHCHENVDTQKDLFPNTMFLLLCHDFTFKRGFK